MHVIERLLLVHCPKDQQYGLTIGCVSAVDAGAPHPQAVGVPWDLRTGPHGSHHVCGHGCGEPHPVCGLRRSPEGLGGEAARSPDPGVPDHGSHSNHQRGKTSLITH